MIIAVGKGCCYRLDNAGKWRLGGKFFLPPKKMTLFNLNSTLKRSFKPTF